MQVRGKSIRGVEITLVDEDALELAHILRLYSISAKNGEQGAGTSVDQKIDLAERVSSAITGRLEA